MPSAKVRSSPKPRVSQTVSRQTVSSRELQDAAGLVGGEVDATIAPQISEGDIGVLLRGLLHELRNPLSSILTASSLLQDNAPQSASLGEEAVMLLGVIEKESRRLNHILTEFSNYIKLPAPEPRGFDLVETTRAVIGDLKREGVLAASVVIANELPARCAVHADPNQIRTALRHLLSNAGEAMPQGGTLRVWLAQNGSHAQLCLSDSGAGFSAESSVRAFQPFYSTKPASVGLGLSSARAILEAAGGKLWIEGDSQTADEKAAAQLCIEVPLAQPET